MRPTSPSPRASVSVPAANVVIPPAAAQEPSLAQQLDDWVNEPFIPANDERTPEQERQARADLRNRVRDWRRENQGLPAENTRHLNLGGLNLSCLPAAIGSLTTLRSLSLSGNRLTHLPPEIGRLRNLDDLDLSYNRLQQLPAEIGQLEHLLHLNVDRNRIADLPPQFADLRNLLRFVARNNPLGSLPEPILQLLNLERLQLSDCGLTELPDAIGGLQSLTELDLESNNLERLPVSIGQLANLRSLCLDSNRLASVPAEIGRLGNLSTLTFHGNERLADLPESVVAMAQRTLMGFDGCHALPLAVRTALYEAREALRARRNNEALALYEAEEAPINEALAQWGDDPLDDEADPLADDPDFLLSQEQRDALSTDQGEPIEHADSFFEWLGRMRETSDYSNLATRPAVEARLTRLIEDMRGDMELRQTCFRVAYEALAECGDRIAVGFNQMHAVALTATTLRPGVDEKTLVGLGIDSFVLALIEGEARAKLAELARVAGARGEEIETVLFFQTELRAPLAQAGINVNLVTQTMRYAGTSGVSAQELSAAAHRISTAYHDGRSMRNFLAEWPPLVTYVNTTYAAQLNEVEQDFRTRLEEVVLAHEQGTIDESDYVTRVNQVMKGLSDAQQQMRQQLMADVLNRNLPRPSV